MGEPTLLMPVTDRSPFSTHPEDWEPQRDSHGEQGAYWKHGLRRLLPDCFVARDLAVYWVPGETQHPYVGPDLFIARSQPRVEDPRAWLTYEDGPLALVLEIASDKTRHNEADKRDTVYARALQVPEYGCVDLHRGELQFGRLREGQYEWVAPDTDGRLWSEQFPFGFLWREGERLVRLVQRDGTVVPTAREESERRAAEETRRRAAEERAARAARRASQERSRAEHEAQQRAAAEQRARELAEEVERLRRRLGEEDSNDRSR
jgi:hypothetical protein